MAQLNPGGLAIIIKSTISEEVGKVVTCLQLIVSGGAFTPPQTKEHSFYWPRGEPPVWMVSGDIRTYCEWMKKKGGFWAEGWGVYTSDQLMPIDGEDFSHEDERQKELTHG